VAHLNQLLGTDIKPSHTSARPGDVRHSQASINRACDELGYEPTTDVVTGLRHCLAWWKQRNEKTRPSERRSRIPASGVA
jgi:nucleoside-diphosphate-sugar epimerase